jgi:hypothetical protein
VWDAYRQVLSRVLVGRLDAWTDPPICPDLETLEQRLREMRDLAAAEAIKRAPSKEQGDGRGCPLDKKRGRLPIPGRRDAIRNAILPFGVDWRHHLSEIFEELDRQQVHMGDFSNRMIDIDIEEGQKTPACKWSDLDLAGRDQRKKVIDALRKYVR